MFGIFLQRVPSIKHMKDFDNFVKKFYNERMKQAIVYNGFTEKKKRLVSKPCFEFR
jgi:hypothetical protein